MGLWGLIKLALIATLVWLLYKGVKGWLTGGEEKRRVSRERARDGQVLDIMVQDPNCGTYIPKREAVKARVRGQDLYFCSQKCRDEYKEKTGSESPEGESKPEQDKV